MTLAEVAAENEEAALVLEGPDSHVNAAKKITAMGWPTSEVSVRRWRTARDWSPTPPTPPSTPVPDGWAKQYEIGPETGTVCSGPTEKAITDPTEILAIWNLDPASFEIVGNITMKAWEVAAKAEVNGEVVIVTKQLFSYKVAVRKRQLSSLPKILVDSWRSALQTQSFLPTAKNSNVEQLSYVTLIADPQLGKEGTTEALANWERGVLGHAEKLQQYLDGGDDVEAVVSFMGDETEGVANNYANQAHTIEYNLSEQLDMDYDMSMWTLKTFLEVLPPRKIKVTSVRSNHGEWTRNGSKDVVTTKADNASTFIRGMVMKTFSEIPAAAGIEWLIGNEGPHVLAELSGVKCFFSHFYEQKGSGTGDTKTRAAIKNQIIGRTEELGDVKLFFTAHFHHVNIADFEGRTQFGCPALEAEKSSGYMLNNYGVWSPPGMMGMIVGRDAGKRGWTDLAVI